MKKSYFVIIASIVLGLSILFSIGFENDKSSAHNITNEPQIVRIIPTQTLLESEESVVETSSSESKSETLKPNLPSIYADFIFGIGTFVNEAQAISPSQNTISFDYWSINGDSSGIGQTKTTINSDGNTVFTISTTPGKIVNLNPNTNTITQWTHSAFVDVQNSIDSTGKIYFGSGSQLSRLDPNTNIITNWNIPGNFKLSPKIAPDNSIFMRDQLSTTTDIVRLDPSTNISTRWITAATVANGGLDLVVDSSGNVYFTDGFAIAKLDPSTNQRTYWNIGGAYPLAIGPSGAIYTTFADKILRLDPTTNTLTTWTFSGGGLSPSKGNIAVDINEMIYVPTGNKVVRLNPSLNQFTIWTNNAMSDAGGISIDSNNNVFFSARIGSSLDEIIRLS